jgi:hypothetical protein
MEYEIRDEDGKRILKITSHSLEERNMLYDLYEGLRGRCGPDCTFEPAVMKEFSEGELEFIEFFVRKREE